MAALSLIIAILLLGMSAWVFVARDWTWWRERVRRAEGVQGDLQPVPDIPDVVAIRQAVEPAVRLVALIHGDVIEVHSGQEVTVPASPAALRRLLCCVLHAAAQGRARSGSDELVGVSVRLVGIQVDNPASTLDRVAVLRRVSPVRGRVARAAQPLGWGSQHIVDLECVLVDVRWSPVEVVEGGAGWAN
jgi:hypothetical protein